MSTKQEMLEQSYLKNGAYHWLSNDAVISPSLWKEYGWGDAPKEQASEYSAYTRAVIESYRSSRKNYIPSREEQFEMRAAHGPGKILVDVFTGQRFKA